ncbi:Citrate exporter 1 [Exophiala dermatitidis]
MTVSRANLESLTYGHEVSAGSEKSTSDSTSSEDEAGPSPRALGQEPVRNDSDNESIGGQRNEMSRKRLMIAIPALSVCLFVSFLDQTSVATATPAMAGDLNTGAATSWIGASFLIASTSFQLINGRLSDLFGRKNLLLACLALMGIGDLACGFSQTSAQLFAFRSIAGVGGGGINSLAMIIVSDITTLQNRGTYQGVFGAIIALANGVGPFLGGALVESATWRWVFWLIPIMCAPTAAVIWYFLPLKQRPGNYVEKIKKIDYGGVVLNIASTLLVLIPLSGGGITYSWQSPFLVSGLTSGFLLGLLFVLYEWKLATLPIMPLRLFKAPHCSPLYAQSFLTGLAYFGNLFYLPIYFQSVLKYSALVSGALILPVIITTSVGSIVSGQYMNRIGRYRLCILTGFCLWTLGNGLMLLFDRHTGLGPLIGILLVQGAGIGLTLQPTLVALYANSRSEDRAVTTGLRNFIRTIGGAFGLVISGAILSNILGRDLEASGLVSKDTIAQLTSSTYVLDHLDISEEAKNKILESYMSGLHFIFVFFIACSGLSLLLTAFVGNTNMKAPKESPAVQVDGQVLEVKSSDISQVEKGLVFSERSAADKSEKSTAGSESDEHNRNDLRTRPGSARSVVG